MTDKKTDSGNLFTMEAVYKVYNDTTGDCIEVFPVEEGEGVVLVDDGVRFPVYFAENVRLVAQAMLMALEGSIAREKKGARGTWEGGTWVISTDGNGR